ncbi:DNA gyrase inhibitor YacG [Bosea lathyri]|uniref:DNA gyrase inhibitor YacG n=1 Tax=Bosea lathyri TaxID=1036778 RepID=A0A1H6BZ43_9HYPH|nr:DNA gyrase inhibitor YacG [Bosea lathyri]SEG65705.1 hypothetical protein SAMN04488115_108200 [Bosea lathyri]
MADNENTPPPMKPCAICGKPAVARYKPFCSARCADIDLGRWLKGNYVIPGEPVDEAETGPSKREQEEE